MKMCDCLLKMLESKAKLEVSIYVYNKTILYIFKSFFFAIENVCFIKQKRLQFIAWLN